ncbi:PREDICTED: zinc finger protein 14-like isoform X1 [Rhagoletis zephyria]|uniref:zinc finger protein 14-like isoform X1 n=1 Tax=Rhagoletis zephyria TaxID=28612 RepID=UPI0008115C47|nr:PREDICTED: zinc finger protein 14-like isoform X1 [Rhagoletis zephyria]
MVIQCRACLNTKDAEFIRMESHISDGFDFFSCFSLCTQLDAGLYDGLPGVLCTNCSQDLQVAFNFVQNARQADRMLRESLSQKLMADELIETLESESGDVSMEPLEVVGDSESEDCVVEELLDEEPTLDEVNEGGEEENTAVEIMEIEKAEVEIYENSLEEIELIESKYEDASAVEDVQERLEPQTDPGECYPEDENDDQYLREYQENEQEQIKMDSVTNGAKWKCIECKRILCGDVSYEGHMNMHRSLRPYKCAICLFAFRCKMALEKHVELRHRTETPIEEIVEESPPNSNCDKCSKTFTTPEELQDHHELVHPESYPVQCRHCPLIAPLTRSKLVEHYRIEHPAEYHIHFPTVGRPLNDPMKTTPWQCEVCKRFMRSEAALCDHRHIHQNERPHECQFCSKRFASTSNLRQHMRGVHVEEYEKLINETGDTCMQCEICKKQLLRRNFEKHMALHIRKEREANEAQTKFLCAYCSRECKNQKSLTQHEKMHQGASSDVIYICADCDRSYATQHLLQQHRKQAHKERDNFCPICGNGFKLKNQLVNHMKLHLEKNIKCPHCEKCYARKFDLDVHMRTHTGELPFACHLCEKRFAIKVRLTYHLQKHYGIKHRCKDCDAEFNSKQKLKAHTYKHTGMPYRCERCNGHGFANRDVFKRHLQRVHCTSMSDEELVAMFQQNTGKSTRIRRVDLYEEHVDREPMKEATEEDGTLINADDIALESEVIHS